MREAMIILCVMAVVFGFFWLVIVISDKYFAWYYKRQHEKHETEHPELMKLFDAIGKKGSECCHWYNENISPKKREVDRLLKEMPYLPEAKKAEAEEKLEKIRCEIYTAQIIDNTLENELRELREQAHEYVRNHNVKWAKKEGWG